MSFHFYVNILCKSGPCPTYSDIYWYASAYVAHGIINEPVSTIEDLLDFFKI
jgi:hypothetical protein